MYTPIKTRLIQIVKFLIKLIKKAINSIVNKIKYAGKQFVDKVAAPLYIYCVDKLIAIKKILIMLFKATKQFFTFVLKILKSLLITFY